MFNHYSSSSKRLIQPNASSQLPRICVSQLIHLSVNTSTSLLTSPRLKHEQPTTSGVNVVGLLQSAEIKSNNSQCRREVFLCPMQLFHTSHSSHVTRSRIIYKRRQTVSTLLSQEGHSRGSINSYTTTATSQTSQSSHRS